MASSLVAMASSLVAMTSNLLAMERVKGFAWHFLPQWSKGSENHDVSIRTGLPDRGESLPELGPQKVQIFPQLGAPGLTTRSKKLLVKKLTTTRSKPFAASFHWPVGT